MPRLGRPSVEPCVFGAGGYVCWAKSTSRTANGAAVNATPCDLPLALAGEEADRRADDQRRDHEHPQPHHDLHEEWKPPAAVHTGVKLSGPRNSAAAKAIDRMVTTTKPRMPMRYHPLVSCPL